MLLNYATIAYNALEAVGAIVAGALAGSVALIGFGVDSVIELTASGAAQWRLRAEVDAAARHRVEGTTVRLIGVSFLALAAYVAYESAETLWLRERPQSTGFGILLTAASAVVMPLLARAKHRVASALGSGSLAAEANQTSLCGYLSIIVLGGLALNALFGWWWADPVAAACMVPIIVREGLEGLRGRTACDDCG